LPISNTGRVIKTIGFILLWLGGSAAAVAVAWAGVSVVDDELVNPAHATTLRLTDDALAGAVPTTNQGGFSLTSGAAALDGDDTTSSFETSSTSPASLSQAPTTERSSTPASQPQATAPPTSKPTTAPTVGSTSSTEAPSSTTTTTTAPESAQTLTFSLVGGSTAISFSSSEVKVLWATPNPGFEVSIEPEGSGIKVEFESDGHESRINAWWSGGPQTDIREKVDVDDDGDDGSDADDDDDDDDDDD